LVNIAFHVREQVTHFRISNIADTFPGEEWLAPIWINLPGFPYRHNLIPDDVRPGAGDGLKTVYLQVKDSLGQVSSVARASITLNELPVIQFFQTFPITTEQRTIILQFDASGATHWRASESQDFSRNLQTGPCSLSRNRPTYTLSEGFGDKKVYLQVMNRRSDNITLYSNIEYGMVHYVPSFGRKDFTISGYDAYEIAKSRAFGFSTIKDLTSDCRMWGNPGGPLVLEAVASRVVGSKCDFFLFGDQQLREGWAFKSYGYQKNCIDGRGDSSADQQPSPGSRDIKFKIHVWADSPENLFGGPSRTICDFFLNSITLEGPENARWQDAF
jgi:hypothetical protein